MKEPYSAGATAMGLRLRQQRLKRGWSQEGLCRDICAASYLSKIEQGQVQAAPELLELLFRRLELPWYGGSLPELERLVEHRYECLLDGDKEGFRDSREIFAHALDRLLSSPLAADGLVLDTMDRAETAPEEYPDRALCMGICGLVRRRLENPGYLRDPDYGAALMDVFNRCRRELPIGYAAFHLPRVLEWLTAGRQYKQAYELLRDFPIKLPNLPIE